MRLRTTHTATVYGDRVTGTNDVGQELTATDAPLVTLRGRYRPQGSGLTSETRGERIDQSPEFVCRATGTHPDTDEYVSVGDVVAAGQRVAIEGDDTTFRIVRVDPHYGRHERPQRYSLELQATTDE